MATGGKKPKYDGDKKVDEWLLNQVVKHVNHDEIGSFARDLEVPESVYSRHSRYEICQLYRIPSFSAQQFGHKQFFQKKCVYPHGDNFIRYLRSSGPHLQELLFYSCYVSFTLLGIDWYLCQKMSSMTVFWNLLVSEIVLSASNLIVLEELSMHW